jgi:hypothetical protein
MIDLGAAHDTGTGRRGYPAGSSGVALVLVLVLALVLALAPY